MAAVLVSRSDFDWEEGFGKPSIARVSSRLELSDEKNAVSDAWLSRSAVSQRASKADFQLLSRC